MKLSKAEDRDRRKNKNRMRVDGKSIFLIDEMRDKRDSKITSGSGASKKSKKRRRKKKNVR